MSQKVEKTYADLLELVRNLNGVQAEPNSKRQKKLKKIAEKVKSIFDEYNEHREDIRLDNAHANAEGVLDLNEKGEYKFTKEGLKQMNKEMKKLLDKSFEFYQLSFNNESIEDLMFLAGWVESISLPEEENEL
jgi:ElaB/YqjD/DUF883 family membrane-anchored ribosome-binding protein